MVRCLRLLREWCTGQYHPILDAVAGLGELVALRHAQLLALQVAVIRWLAVMWPHQAPSSAFKLTVLGQRAAMATIYKATDRDQISRC